MEKKLKIEIENIIHEISADIIYRFDKRELNMDAGLLSGRAGAALYMFYAGRLFKNEKYHTYAKRLLVSAFDNVNAGSLLPTYCSGIAGIGWAVQHLINNKYIDDNNIDVLEEFDTYLINALHGFYDTNNFDFLHGATGIILYLLQRDCNNAKIIESFELYINKLHKHAIFDDKNNTAKLISIIQDKDYKEKEVYNLSLSHGMSSIIIILTRLMKLVKNRVECQNLITGFSNYILSCEKPINSIFSRYPSYIEVKDNSNDTVGRLAWCYGDIGLGFSLLNSGKTLGNKEYIKKSDDIFKELYRRKDLPSQQIKDTGICHGTAGIAAISSSLYSKTHNLKYKEIEKYWIEMTLNYYHKEENITGFGMFFDENYIFDNSLLVGTAGVGLVLISYVSKEQYNWDKMLLID